MKHKEKEQSLNLAEHYFRDKNYSFAQQIISNVLRVDPSNSRANELLAYIHAALGSIDLSFTFLKFACNQHDCTPAAHYYLGSMQLDRGFFSLAIENFKKSISKGGEFFEALHDMGTAQAQMGDLSSALQNYQKCLKFDSSSYELFYNIARIFDELKQYDDAISYYNKALSINPEYAEGWSNKGCALKDLKQYDEAIIHFNKALILKPEYAAGWFNKALTLHELKSYHEAIACYEKALSFNPNIEWADGGLLYANMKICNWSGIANSLANIQKKVIAGARVVPPFALLSATDDALLHKKAAQIFAKDKYSFNPVLGPIAKAPKKEKIRIAYFSPDFLNHPVALLTSELFEIHDRDRFEVFAFSLQKATSRDVTNERLRGAFDRFIDVENMQDQEIAKLARELEVDIAIDLAGPTKNSRTSILSYRVAPIQVNWLGYPGTFGADFIDYILADRTIIPESHKEFYVEKVVYLPYTYMVDDSKRVASSRVFTREECGLPEDAFVFCCFNNDYKFNSQVLDGWSEILHLVENSVLWLSENNVDFRTNIVTEFERRGIESSRIIFATKVDLMSDHLSRYSVADLFLDTHPYNAHTTSVDSLKACIPVLTLMGQSFASRVAASLLNAIGLPELITTTQAEYVALAVELAKMPEKLADIKFRLANNLRSTPLFNTPLFAKNIEAAYIRMHELYLADQKLDHIYISY